MKRSLKNILAAALVCGALVTGGSVYAAPSGNGAAEFKAAYIVSPDDNRIMSGGLNIFGPYFHGDVDGSGQFLSDGTIRFDGKLDWIFTDKNTNQTTNKSIPLYLEQRNGAMNVYVYRNFEWNKYSLPGIPQGLAATLKSADPKVLAANMEAVKSVQKIGDKNGNKTFKLVLDGKKLSGIVKKKSNARTDAQKVFINRLATALNKADVTIEWTVDTSTNKTLTINGNFTPLLRAYAKGVIDEMAAGKIKLTDEEKNYYAALGYYAEMPFFISKNAAPSSIMAPTNLNSAKDNQNVFADIRKDIASTPTK